MQKLKCEQCGGNIELDKDNKEFATCPYCKTKYQLNETKNVYIKMDEDIKQATLDAFKNTQKAGKVIRIIAISMFVVIFSIFIIGFISQKSSTSSFNVKRYNSQYEFYKGTKTKQSISTLIDDVITNNKKEKNKITVVFKEIETKDPDELLSIKKELDNYPKQYEIILDYNKKGLVDKITIEEIE